MLLLRSLLFFVLMVLGVIVFGPLVLLAFPFSLETRYRISRWFPHYCLWALRVVCRLDHSVEGVENIPDSAHIIMAKHQSAWETLSLQVIFPVAAFVMKRELFKVPVFGWAMAMLKPVAIDRGAGRAAARQVIEQGTWHLEQGRCVIIFPEGTRTAPGNRKRYGIGGALLARSSGFPVVPVAHNAGEFWRRRGILKYPGTIQVVIGPVIQTRGRKADAINREVETWIESTMERISSVPVTEVQEDPNGSID